MKVLLGICFFLGVQSANACDYFEGSYKIDSQFELPAPFMNPKFAIITQNGCESVVVIECETMQEYPNGKGCYSTRYTDVAHHDYESRIENYFLEDKLVSSSTSVITEKNGSHTYNYLGRVIRKTKDGNILNTGIVQELDLDAKPSVNTEVWTKL